MKKTAFITGVFGQDGAYLAQLLLSKGYRVVGGYRRSSSLNDWRLKALKVDRDVELAPFDILEFSNILRMIEQYQPDELYNLAAQSFVSASFEQPLITSDINALGAARLLEALRTIKPECKFYQASTSEMYGSVVETPQRESTPFYPRSPYGVSKVYAHWMTVNYREAFDMYAASGILFNHESPLRGREFVTRKITTHLAEIHAGKRDVLALGNLEAKRDWGFAGDYVEGMWLMLQQEKADDYVLATGESRSVREFVSRAAETLGFDLAWEGEGQDAKALDRKTGKTIVTVDASFFRPAEVNYLIGDPSKARRELGWEPKTTFGQLVDMMIESDLAQAVSGC